jgi:DnaJ-class molecular chaperone
VAPAISAMEPSNKRNALYYMQRTEKYKRRHIAVNTAGVDNDSVITIRARRSGTNGGPIWDLYVVLSVATSTVQTFRQDLHLEIPISFNKLLWEIKLPFLVWKGNL